jgi:hypothetical protein
MPEMFNFRVHWMYKGKVYFDEFCAASESQAAQYFNENKRSAVSLVRVVYIGPDDGGGGVQEIVHSPDSPFSPLMARRRLDKDEDAR